MRSLRAAFLLALCVHAPLTLAFVCVRPPAPASAALVEHEVTLVELPAPPEEAVMRSLAQAFEPGKHVVSSRAAPAKSAASRGGSSHPAPGPVADVMEGAAVVTTVALVHDAVPALGLSFAHAYAAASGAVVPERAEGPPPGTTALGSVRAALADHDRALGLGTDSALVAAIRHAALGSRIPVKSTAVLWAKAGADGALLDAEAKGASSDAEAWNEMAAEVVRAMKGRQVRTVLGARGALLSFRVESLVRQGAGNAVAPSVRIGTPLYRCMESCTASGNIDPTDAILSATSHAERFVDVRALSSARLD
jgi:hypothetical protein